MLSYGNVFLRKTERRLAMSMYGIKHGKAPDSSEIHQKNEKDSGNRSQGGRDPQRKPDRSNGGSTFKKGGRKGNRFETADNDGKGHKHTQIHRYNRSGTPQQLVRNPTGKAVYVFFLHEYGTDA